MIIANQLLAAITKPSLILQPLLDTLGHMLPMFIVLGVLVVALKLLKRPAVKGMIGEAAVNWGGLSRLDKSQYTVLKNIYVPSIAGTGTTEIDHVVVSVYGIFVLETKNYKGWIFGGEHDRMWTRSDYGKKRQFLNPLIQNKLHVDSLAAFLGLPQHVFHSVVFFIGDAELKTPMPANVLTSGLLAYITGKKDNLIAPSEATKIGKLLTEHGASMNKRAVRRAHVDRLSASTNR